MEIFIIAIVGSLILCIGVAISNKRYESKPQTEKPPKKLEELTTLEKTQFFQKCKENKISDITSAANKQRAILIAQQMKLDLLTEETVEAAFLEGMEEITRQENSKLLAKQNQVQKAEDEKFTKFKDLRGRDKRIKMIESELKPLREASNAIDIASNAIKSSVYQEKELNWASMGGAASAIGGTAAGLSIALQAQHENENIRAKNAANRAAASRLVLSMYDSALPIDNKINALETRLQKAQLALVDDKLSKEALFEQLKISHSSKIDDIGILNITADVRLKERITIFEDVPAAIDGTLIAKVFVDDECVGQTMLVFPFDGIFSPFQSQKVNLEGKIWVKNINSTDKYIIEITPYSLWAIERECYNNITLTPENDQINNDEKELVHQINISEGVKIIGNYAFSSCQNLERITISNSVTSISKGAFSSCTGLTSIAIPDSVTSIGDYAFRYCTGLKSVTIGNGVTSIGKEAFEGCKGLTSITIPDSVTSIGDDAFYECTGLKSVTIGNGVKSIGNHAFWHCTGLTSVTIDNGITSIGEYAFYNCTELKSINIPGSVKSIGNDAFNGCAGLTSVTIGNGITSIGSYAFYNCTELKSINIPGSVKSIGNDAFNGCAGLTSVTIDNGITSIDGYAFYNCSELTGINFNGTKAQWQAIKKVSSSIGSCTIHCTDGDIKK